MLARVLNGLFGVAGAGSASQLPAFYQQYTLVLKGMLTKAERDAEPLREFALKAGKSLDELLEGLTGNNPEFAALIGEGARNDLRQALEYREAYDALASAGPLERWYVFGQHFDAEIASKTFESFEPAVPVTPEAAAYAGIGLLLGLLLLAGGERGMKGAVRRARGRKDSPHTARDLREPHL
ncbi:MAG: DUF2937 family protein [Rhodovibrionaceae bacterium]|nr:DUF2937 family protein [Rhodovibrionaceae bacterium]